MKLNLSRSWYVLAVGVVLFLVGGGLLLAALTSDSPNEPSPSISSPATTKATVGAPGAEPRSQVVSFSELPETCQGIETTEVLVNILEVKRESLALGLPVGSGCQVDVTIRVRAEAPDGPANSTCTLRFAPIAPEVGDSPGVSYFIESSGVYCEYVEVESTIILAPPKSNQTISGGPRRSVVFNPWTYMQFEGKVTGQDIVNVDMFWNEVHLSWYQDGYCAGWGSRTMSNGVDPWWNANFTISWGNTGQSNCVNHFYAVQESSFTSSGFSHSSFPDVASFTAVTLKGYYDGYATCQFSHSYSGNTWFYPNLHWRDDCRWE